MASYRDPVQIKLSVDNVQATIGRVYAYEREAELVIQEEVAAHAARLLAKIRENMLAFSDPIQDTGFMYEHTEVRIDRDGFRVEAGWWGEEFIGKRRAGPYGSAEIIKNLYPLFVVFGTEQMPARDPLFPAYEETRPIFTRNLRVALSKAARLNRESRAQTRAATGG